MFRKIAATKASSGVLEPVVDDHNAPESQARGSGGFCPTALP